MKAYNEAHYIEAITEMRKVSNVVVDAFFRQNPRAFCRALLAHNANLM